MATANPEEAIGRPSFIETILLPLNAYRNDPEPMLNSTETSVNQIDELFPQVKTLVLVSQTRNSKGIPQSGALLPTRTVSGSTPIHVQDLEHSLFR